MVIKPKVRGFICTTAHPLGCAAKVAEWIDFTEKQNEKQAVSLTKLPFKKALIIGGSTGYGLASRIVAAFGMRAKTLNVCYERPPSSGRTASAGYYNTVAFEKRALEKGLYARTLNADAFSKAAKQRVCEELKREFGTVDLIIYSLASPKRVVEQAGGGVKVFSSVLKPINSAGAPLITKALRVDRGEVFEMQLNPASEEEIEATIKVMGGEDWEAWVAKLHQEKVLAPNFLTLAYSYLGPQITQPVYRQGTIGRAKEHLESTAQRLRKKYAALKGQAFVSINKAIVTQAAAAIPVLPLYLTLLYQVMKEKGIHETAIEQLNRLFREKFSVEAPSPQLDSQGLIRLDDWELSRAVQQEVERRWRKVTTATLSELGDLTGYKADFLSLFGFGQPGILYDTDTEEKLMLSNSLS